MSKRPVPIQFMGHDSDQGRLEKLRRLAEQVADSFSAATVAAGVGTVFTDTANGLVPAPNGATGSLQADGSWLVITGGGATWRVGVGAPSDTLGVNGDFYLNNTNGDVYEKAAGVYGIVANIKGPQGDAGDDGTDGTDGVDGVVQTVVGTAGEVDVDSTDPANLVVSLAAAAVASLALADSAVQSVVAGTNVTVDNTDPQNPIVNASGGGGGGYPPQLGHAGW